MTTVLTNRQREVLYLIAYGNTAKEIAQLLGIAYCTVKDHTNDIHERLGVTRNDQAVAKAYQRGILI